VRGTHGSKTFYSRTVATAASVRSSEHSENGMRVDSNAGGHASVPGGGQAYVTHVGVSRSINLKLISREIIFEVFQPM